MVFNSSFELLVNLSTINKRTHYVEKLRLNFSKVLICVVSPINCLFEISDNFLFSRKIILIIGTGKTILMALVKL